MSEVLKTIGERSSILTYINKKFIYKEIKVSLYNRRAQWK